MRIYLNNLIYTLKLVSIYAMHIHFRAYSKNIRDSEYHSSGYYRLHSEVPQYTWYPNRMKISWLITLGYPGEGSKAPPRLGIDETASYSAYDRERRKLLNT